MVAYKKIKDVIGIQHMRMLFHCGTLLIDIRRRIDPQWVIHLPICLQELWAKPTFRRSHWRCSVKKGVLKNFANFTECLFWRTSANDCCLSLVMFFLHLNPVMSSVTKWVNTHWCYKLFNVCLTILCRD